MTNHLPTEFLLMNIEGVKQIADNRYSITKDKKTISINLEQIEVILPQLTKTVIRLKSGIEIRVYLTTFKVSTK